MMKRKLAAARTLSLQADLEIQKARRVTRAAHHLVEETLKRLDAEDDPFDDELGLKEIHLSPDEDVQR